MNRLNIISCAIYSFLVFSSVSVAKETQNPIEAAIVTHVKSDHQRAMTLLKEAVDINSGTMNFA
ncbi:MAG: hypothetical protein KA350_06780, partial [Arenimonas sp.]|nr:hypothetical protein [Arenimonas sp.]